MIPEKELPRLGFIGLGAMGYPMVSRLLKAGNIVRVYDIRRAAMERIAPSGAVMSTGIRDLTSESELVFTSLPSPEALESVTLSPDGVLTNARPGTIIVITDTVLPSLVRKISELGKDRQVSVVDAPVSGSVARAETGELTIMVGAESHDLSKIRPVLESIGTKIIHVGPVGAGQGVKLVNNLMEYSNLVAMCESLIMGIKSGLDLKTIQRVVETSTGNSYVFQKLLDRPLASREFSPPKAALRIALKDLKLIQRFSRELGITTFFADLLVSLYELACTKGWSELDYTAIVQLYEEIAGIQVK